MWFPRKTRQTVPDTRDHQYHNNLLLAWLGFIALACVTCIAGWVLMEAAKVIADQTGLSDTLVGGLLTALATSAPELVTTVAAIRYGALTLGVSNIFGTNCFNILVVAAADFGYRQGSIYNDIEPVQMMWGLAGILMAATLLLGMIRRQTYGIGRIGFESALILAAYAVVLGVIVANG
jgi:cation:H+ antiporter